VKINHSLQYGVAEKGDILSVVYWIDPTVEITDPTDLTDSPSHDGTASDGRPPNISETEAAMQMLEASLDNMVELDEYLDKFDTVRSKMTSESRALLQSARYDVQAYNDWLEQKRGDDVNTVAQASSPAEA
jgi:hypothetical protein